MTTTTPAATAGMPPWDVVGLTVTVTHEGALSLRGTVTAINPWGNQRSEAAGTLHAALAGLDDVEEAEALPAYLLAWWLGRTGGPRLVCVGAELAAYVLADPELDVADLRIAWLTTHRHTLTGSGQDRADER